VSAGSRKGSRRWLTWIAPAVAALIVLVSLLRWRSRHGSGPSEAKSPQDHAPQSAPSYPRPPVSAAQSAEAAPSVQAGSAGDSKPRAETTSSTLPPAASGVPAQAAALGGSSESDPVGTPARPSGATGATAGPAGNPARLSDAGATGGQTPRGLPPDPRAQGAWKLAVAATSRLLKEPAAAVFPDLGTPGTSARADGHAYRVEGFVDAPNSLGAVRRIRFTCIVCPAQRSSGWEVTGLELSD